MRQQDKFKHIFNERLISIAHQKKYFNKKEIPEKCKLYKRCSSGEKIVIDLMIHLYNGSVTWPLSNLINVDNLLRNKILIVLKDYKKYCG